MSPRSKSLLLSCTDWLTCRQVLNLMVFLGFMVNYMLRVNFAMAVVAMVSTSNSSLYDSKVTSEENRNETQISDASENEGSPKYQWDAYTQNLILGCFFWGYICTELPGGRMAEVFGARRIFGYSTMFASVLTFLTPLACNLGYVAVILLRVLLGFLLGVTWPAIPPICSKWIPPMERSKFMSNMMASSLGAAFTMPMSGILISSFGWESLFYVTGFLGLTWSVIWFLVVFDTPAQHPRISATEKNFIEEAIGYVSAPEKVPVPWTKILTSAPVWSIVITHSCSVFGYFTVINQLPTFTKYILHYDIKANGVLSSLPYFGKYVFALATSYLADHLRKSNKLTTTATRKIFTSFAVITPGVLMVVQVYLGRDRIVSIAIFTLALSINGAVTAGYLSNGLDIAPNFSGTIFGIANTLSSLGGFLSSLMVGMLTQENQTYRQWQIIFWILSATYVFGGLIFLCFGTGEQQSWNLTGQNKNSEDLCLRKTNLLKNEKSER